MRVAGGASPAELWTGLVAAARGEVSSTVARAALALSADEGRPRLGWVIPPPWDGVEQRIAEGLRAEPIAAGASGVAGEIDVAGAAARAGPCGRAGPAAHRCGSLIVATGGWAFAALAASETAAPGYRLSVVDTLDAGRLARYLAGCDGDDAALAVSGSGQTYETRCLAELVSVAWRSRPGGGPPWLTDSTVAGGLSLRAPDAINALLGPLSVPFAVACAMTGPERFRRAYAQFARLAPLAGYRAAALACAVPPRPGARISLLLPSWTGTGVRLWALQALRQGLGGKPDGPAWCDVGADLGGGPGPGTACIRLAGALPDGVAEPGPDPAAALASAMTVMYATAVVVACLGLRFGVAFASHPAVAGYKALLTSRPGCDELVADPSGITPAAAEWLAGRPGLSGAHLVDYGSGAPCAEPGQTWEVHLGSRWNHHSYQAVHGERRLGVVAVVGDRPPEVRTGDDSLDVALRGLHERQVAIARATCASLAGRALLIRVAEPGRGR
jgi:hypothetical protein